MCDTMKINENLVHYEYNSLPVKEILNDKAEIQSNYLKYGVRHVQLIIVFLCVTVNFMLRGHIGATIVAMTSHDKENVPINVTHRNIENNTLYKEDNYNDALVDGFKINMTNNNGVHKAAEPVNNTAETVIVFDWPKSIQEMVLGSFFLGYCLMTFPAGMISQRWGGKVLLQIALFFNGIVSILTPWLTIWGGWKAVCVCRIIQGMTQCGVYPGTQTLLAKWVPIKERATLSSYVYTGSTLGTVIAFQMIGFLCDTRWGWPSAFWAIGVLSLSCLAVLTLFGSDSPANHRTISVAEKNYILGDSVNRTGTRLKTPWRAIITSKPVWGSLATHAGSGVIFVFFFTQVPSYIHHVLGIDIKRSGLLSSLPYFTSFFASIMFGIASDFVINRKIISRKNTRRISNSISQFGIALSLICASFCTTTAMTVLCFVLAMGCHQGMHTGWMVNHIDLSPNFSGTLMAFGNTFMNILNVTLPCVVSFIVTDMTNILQWRTMIFIVAGVAIICNIIFVTLMSADVQPWDNMEAIGDDVEDLKEEKSVDEDEKQ